MSPVAPYAVNHGVGCHPINVVLNVELVAGGVVVVFHFSTERRIDRLIGMWKAQWTTDERNEPDCAQHIARLSTKAGGPEVRRGTEVVFYFGVFGWGGRVMLGTVGVRGGD